MSEAKFTPAPWDSTALSRHKTIVIEYNPDFTQAGGRVVANVTGRDDEGVANAHLIAAAPDLYEALEKLCIELNGLEAFEEEVRFAIGNTIWAVIQSKIQDATAAILKARGETVEAT